MDAARDGVLPGDAPALASLAPERLVDERADISGERREPLDVVVFEGRVVRSEQDAAALSYASAKLAEQAQVSGGAILRRDDDPAQLALFDQCERASERRALSSGAPPETSRSSKVSPTSKPASARSALPAPAGPAAR